MCDDILMKNTITLLALLLSQTSFAESFTSKDQKTTVTVHQNMMYNCLSGRDVVAYTVFDNQTDKKDERSCVLTYSYYRCHSEMSDPVSCTDKKLDYITKDKVIALTDAQKDLCSDMAKKMVAKLKAKKFNCADTGIN